MMKKIDIRLLIKEHYKTLYNIEYDKITKKEIRHKDYRGIFLLFFLPLILSFILTTLFGFVEASFSNSLLTCLSILSPLMFGFFPIIYELTDNEKINPKSKEYIKEFKSNVLFTMILSFLTLGLVLFWTLINPTLTLENLQNVLKDYTPLIISIIKYSCSIIIFYFSISLGLHILMIIQRFNFLINEFIKFQMNNKNT